jgi:hypothetical protein
MTRETVAFDTLAIRAISAIVGFMLRSIRFNRVLYDGIKSLPVYHATW